MDKANNKSDSITSRKDIQPSGDFNFSQSIVRDNSKRNVSISDAENRLPPPPKDELSCSSIPIYDRVAKKLQEHTKATCLSINSSESIDNHIDCEYQQYKLKTHDATCYFRDQMKAISNQENFDAKQFIEFVRNNIEFKGDIILQVKGEIRKLIPLEQPDIDFFRKLSPVAINKLSSELYEILDNFYQSNFVSTKYESQKMSDKIKKYTQNTGNIKPKNYKSIVDIPSGYIYKYRDFRSTTIGKPSEVQKPVSLNYTGKTLDSNVKEDESIEYFESPPDSSRYTSNSSIDSYTETEAKTNIDYPHSQASIFDKRREFFEKLTSGEVASYVAETSEDIADAKRKYADENMLKKDAERFKNKVYNGSIRRGHVKDKIKFFERGTKENDVVEEHPTVDKTYNKDTWDLYQRRQEQQRERQKMEERSTNSVRGKSEPDTPAIDDVATRERTSSNNISLLINLSSN